MPKIGDLVLGVVAETSRANRNIRQTRREFALLSTTARRGLGGINRMVASLTGLAAISFVGVAAGITKTARSIDDLAKTADKLGTGTEQLAGLRFAGELTGVAGRTMDMALQRMVRRISEASQGMGEARGALKELRIDAKKLSELTTDQQFFRIADAMKSVRSQSDQVRLAFKLFDSEGVALLNTLKLGGSELRKLTRKAQGLGFALSREEAAKVERFNDELAKLKATAGGQLQRFTVDVSVHATRFVRAVQLWLIEARKLALQITPMLPDETDTPKNIAFMSNRQRELEMRRLREIRAFQDRTRGIQVAQQTQRGLGAAGRGILGTLQGATGLTRGNLDKLTDAATQFQHRMREATFREMTIGRWRREAAQHAAERERQEKAERMAKEQEKRRNQLASRIAFAFNNQPTSERRLNPLAERGTTEAYNALRRNIAGGGGKKSLEEITKQVVREEKQANQQLGEIVELLKTGVEIP